MTEPATSTIHATCIRVGPFGVLITGPSGSGKSDLALRLIDQPGRGAGGTVMDAVLIADDRVVLTPRNGELTATAPGAIKGLMEIRSVGVVAVPESILIAPSGEVMSKVIGGVTQRGLEGLINQWQADQE